MSVRPEFFSTTSPSETAPWPQGDLDILAGPNGAMAVRLEQDGQCFAGITMQHFTVNPDIGRTDIDFLIRHTGDFLCQTRGGGLRVVLCEGQVPDDIPDTALPSQALVDHIRGEKAMQIVGTRWHYNTKRFCGDGADHERAARLLTQGFSYEEIILGLLMREATTWKPEQMTFQAHCTQRVTDRYSRSLQVSMDWQWQTFDFSYEYLSGLYYGVFGRPFASNEAPFCYDEMIGVLFRPVPLEAPSRVQQLALADNDNRHFFLTQNSLELWHKGYHIITQFGPTHEDAIVALARELQRHPRPAGVDPNRNPYPHSYGIPVPL